MTGLTPVPRVFVQSCTAPAMEPWSVRLTAGISSSAARSTRSVILHAPSRIEYSEWTCRWTKSAVFEAAAMAGWTSYAGPRTGPACRPGEAAEASLLANLELTMTFVDPGAIGECDARTQGGADSRSYRRDRGRRSVPPSAAGRHNRSL